MRTTPTHPTFAADLTGRLVGVLFLALIPLVTLFPLTSVPAWSWRTVPFVGSRWLFFSFAWGLPGPGKKTVPFLFWIARLPFDAFIGVGSPFGQEFQTGF